MGWKNQDQNAFRQSRQQAIDRGRTGPEHQHIFFGIIGRYPKAQKYRSVMGLSVTGLSCLLKGLPEAVWLLLRRSLAAIRNTVIHQQCGIGYKLKTLVWLNGLRWAIEQYFEKAKIELSMDQYEVRKLPGWQYHMLTCVLTYFFLWHLIIRMGKSTVCLLRCHNLRSFSNSIRQ